MRVVFDTETYRASSGQQAPRLVCLTWTDEAGKPHGIARHQGAAAQIERWLDQGATLVGHNVSFDLAVAVEAGVPHHKVWTALREGRVRDTYIISQLRAIQLAEHKFNPRTSRRPTFSLAELAQDILCRQRDDKGSDSWRLRYHELEGVDFSDYPEAAKSYALQDAIDTDQIDRRLGKLPPDSKRKTISQYSLHLTTCHGLRADPEAVQALEATLRSEVENANEQLKAAGILKGNGSKHMRTIYDLVRSAYAKQGLPAPQTTKQEGTTKTKADVETLHDSLDPMLMLLAQISNSNKILSTYVPYLTKATEEPVHPKYGMAETGRTTSWGKNIQNQPRKGGVRECYVPRKGYWYLSADYHVAELASLAQICIDLFGDSLMAQAIVQGKDLHILAASQILGIRYETALLRYKAKDPQIKEARQLAKALNFGLPGGLGARSFSAYAQSAWGVALNHDQSAKLKQLWLDSWPEMGGYFKEIAFRVQSGGGQFTAVQHRSKRERGGVSYCNGCNTYFQGLTADGARLALVDIAEECYITTSSPLFGCRPVAFIHDEVMLEVPADLAVARAAAKRLTEVMVRAMERFTPDVPSRADAHIMDRWYKAAEPTYNGQGELVLWQPEQK